MATTIADVSVDDTAWVDLNTASGIAIGDAMFITNKSPTWCRLYEGAVAPALNITDGQLISDMTKFYATAAIPAGSLAIWALSTQVDRGLRLSVQPL
jgi:hypothetical protein